MKPTNIQFLCASLVFFASNRGAAQSCFSVNSDKWQQCGGKNVPPLIAGCVTSGDHQWANCPISTSCQSHGNVWYWQCEPITASGGLQEYQTCSPSQTCGAGLACIPDSNNWYSCQLAHQYPCLNGVSPFQCSGMSTPPPPAPSPPPPPPPPPPPSPPPVVSSPPPPVVSPPPPPPVVSPVPPPSSSDPPRSTAPGTPGSTTRYWDCCKAACAWNVAPSVFHAATQCDKNAQSALSGDPQSVQNGGPAVMCSDQTPWVSSTDPTLAYGYAARQDLGGDFGKTSKCGFCYELTFTSTSLAASNKRMIVQVNNLGGDVGPDQFDIAMPGSGVGQFPACCAAQFPGFSGGNNFGGANDATTACAPFASDAKLFAGCQFRFGWFEGADNPSIVYRPVSCPSALVEKSGLHRV